MKIQKFCVKKALFCVWLITMQLPGFVEMANILCLMGAPSPSHHIWNRALMEMLANRGHNLTILTVEMEISSKNMHYIFMENIYEELAAHLSTEELLDLSRRSPLTLISEMHDFHNFVSRKLIATKGIQELLRYPRKFKFDAIIHDFTLGQVLLGFVHYFQYPPLIAVSPFGIPAHTSVLAGSNLPLSYVPHFTTTFSPPFGLVNRTKNGFYHAFDWFYRRFIFMPNENEYAVELFGPKIPKLERIEQMSTLILVNSDFSIDHVQPLPPNVITVGGLQVKRMDFRDKVGVASFFVFENTLLLFFACKGC
jgi:glucuronosyltransferase